MYAKFFASTFTGSMTGAGEHVFAVWAYLLAQTVDGLVEINPILAAAAIGTTSARIQEALTFLEAPDPDSRNPDEDGRRLVKLQAHSYRVVSHELYRTMRNEDDRRAYNRDKQREARARKSVSTRKSLTRKVSNRAVNDCQPMSALSAHTEAEAEAEAERAKNAHSRRARATSLEHPDIETRAAKLVERYGELYHEHRHGARYRQRPNLDWLDACDLCRTWTDDKRLEKLAIIVLTTDEEWISRTDRAFKIFALKASWADSRLCELEKQHGVTA